MRPELAAGQGSASARSAPPAADRPAYKPSWDPEIVAVQSGGSGFAAEGTGTGSVLEGVPAGYHGMVQGSDEDEF